MPPARRVYSWYQACVDHRFPAFDVDVRNFALINYVVPASRIQSLVPSQYELETFDSDEGPVGFVTTTCFCNDSFRTTGIGLPRLTFDESTFRTYVIHKERRGVYFVGRYLSRLPATVSQRLFARHTWQADFKVAIDLAGDGYRSYSFHLSSRNGEASFAITARDRPSGTEHFASGEEHAQFFTYRLHGFYTSSLGFQGHMPVDHPRMDPYAGELAVGRMDLWTGSGVLSADEVARPYSVLVQPAVPFTLYAPRPLL